MGDARRQLPNRDRRKTASTLSSTQTPTGHVFEHRFRRVHFIGGAIGSMLAGILWQAGGWSFLITGQALIILLALVVWASNRTNLDKTLQLPKIRAGPPIDQKY